MLAKDFSRKIAPRLMKKLGKKNLLSVPRVEKVIINMGIAGFRDDKTAVEEAKKELAQITGRHPQLCRARKAISGFHLRRNELIGLKVTLRRRQMYDFLERLFHLVLPRLRDFRGLSLKSFDKYGNYTLGISEQAVFPEISPDQVRRIKGLEITIVTSTNSLQEAQLLLESLGAIFERKQ